MITKKVIKTATTEWAAPFVFTLKKDGSLRFCVDYQKLNDVTICYLYPLPRIDVCVDRLEEATVF